MLPGFLTVYHHLGLLINTFKVKLYYLALRCRKRLAILPFATRIPTAIGTRGTGNRVGCISDSPVVR